MIVLGIESSCDETSASIVRYDIDPKKRILSNVINSQIDLHKKYGTLHESACHPCTGPC